MSSKTEGFHSVILPDGISADSRRTSGDPRNSGFFINPTTGPECGLGWSNRQTDRCPQHTWGAGAGEVAPIDPLFSVGAGAVVATGSGVAGIKFLTEASSVSVLTLAEESALQKRGTVLERLHLMKGFSNVRENSTVMLLMTGRQDWERATTNDSNEPNKVLNISVLMISSSHLRWLCNTFALPRAMKVTKVTEARLYTGAGLHCQVEMKDDLYGGWGTKTQHTYHQNVLICSSLHSILHFFKQMYLEISECWT